MTLKSSDPLVDLFAGICAGIVMLGGLATALTAISAIIVRVYNKLAAPHKERWTQSEEEDKKLHERIDKLEEREELCMGYFKNDLAAINSLRRENNQIINYISNLSDGVFLIIQHSVTNDHVDDMEKWMRDYIKNAVDIKEPEEIEN